MKRNQTLGPGWIKVSQKASRVPDVWSDSTGDFFKDPKGYERANGEGSYRAEWIRQMQLPQKRKLAQTQASTDAAAAKTAQKTSRTLTLFGMVIVAEVTYMLVKFGTLLPSVDVIP